MIHIRLATEEDIPRIIELYDELTITTSQVEKSRSPSLDHYKRVFVEIRSDRRQELLVAEDQGEVVGTLVFLLAPNLSHNGTPWAFLENLIVTEKHRRKGVARSLLEYAVCRAREAGCHKVQLCSGKTREEAHELYRSLGFEASAYGFRLYF